ncbi:MAG: arylsulfatase [Rhodospirillaceae bacterium]|nr:arylsulfatase [Rhodospirillaceae bacterium]
MPAPARITLVHALRDSMVPIWDAFSDVWPEAKTFNLLDDSLSADLAEEGELTDQIVDRFLTLGRYAKNSGAKGKTTDAILFTCSAFGPAIDAVKRDLDIPVFTPNEAAFEEAAAIGGHTGLVVTFPPSAPSLSKELSDLAEKLSANIKISTVLADGALAALQAGQPEKHDEIIAETAATLGKVDSIVLGQFSMARAAQETSHRVDAPIITTPTAAVHRLRTLFDG